MLLSGVFRVGWPSFQILTALSDWQSLNTSLLKVTIASKNERVYIHALSVHTLQIIFDAWWASMNIGSMRCIVWNNSRHAHSWRLYWHCGIVETGSPAIICIVCHQVHCHPSEYGTTSMGKHGLAKAHIAKLYQLTESEVTELTRSKVNETALAIWKTQGSRGNTIVSSQSQIIFDIQVIPYWPKWQTKHSKLAPEDFGTSEFHQHTWNHYLMLGFVLAHIPCNAISYLELRRSWKALRNELVPPSVTTLSNICRREFTLNMDAITKQLPPRNTVSLALDGWTSKNKLAIT